MTLTLSKLDKLIASAQAQANAACIQQSSGAKDILDDLIHQATPVTSSKP